MASNEHSSAGSLVIDVAPNVIFDVLADPTKHPIIDGSGTLQEGVTGPERLQLGSRFGMRMRMGVGYRVSNQVVEFEQDRLIAWKHAAPFRWRYQLTPEGDGATKVTETFDYSRIPLPGVIGKTGLPRRSEKSIEQTLRRLKAYVETGEVG